VVSGREQYFQPSQLSTHLLHKVILSYFPLLAIKQVLNAIDQPAGHSEGTGNDDKPGCGLPGHGWMGVGEGSRRKGQGSSLLSVLLSYSFLFYSAVSEFQMAI